LKTVEQSLVADRIERGRDVQTDGTSWVDVLPAQQPTVLKRHIKQNNDSNQWNRHPIFSHHKTPDGRHALVVKM